METISVIAGIILFVVWIFMIIGLINPKWIQLKNRKELTRKRIILWGLGATILLTIIGVSTNPSEEKIPGENITSSSPSELKNNDQNPSNEVKQEANLGMTPEQFRSDFNKRLKTLDVHMIRPLAEFDIEKGEVRDIFQVPFSNQINMTGTVNKDGMLREITFIIVPNEDSAQVMLDTLTLINTASNTVNSSADKNITGKVVVDLVQKALEGADQDNNSHSQVVGNIKYYALASKYTGLWFGLSPVDDK